MKKYLLFLLIILSHFDYLTAQRIVTYEECQQLALKNNKNISLKKVEQNIATYNHKSALTNYLPKIDFSAGYILSGQELQILNKNQREGLESMGSNTIAQMNQNFASVLAKNPALLQQVQKILIQHPELGSILESIKTTAGQAGKLIDGIGKKITDAFRTDTRNIAIAAIVLKQPLYMGGKIKAYDKITRYQRELASEQLKLEEENIILETNKAYWQTVSLANKLKLALSYQSTLKHLDNDVQKMIKEGVATKANGLQVAVKLNEAEMLVTKVEDGLKLSKMLLCQLCGLPLDSNIQTADENKENLNVSSKIVSADTLLAFKNRPELKQLENATKIYKQNVNIVRSDFLPHIALVAGYGFSYPNLYNGFEKKLYGDWHIGVNFKVPLWNWFEGKYKIKAAKAQIEMSEIKREHAKEMIALQVTQEALRVNESNKRLSLTIKNLEKANENLRTATLGYKEGAIAMIDVLEAETAWLQAHSDKIDAEIDTKLSYSELQKALGLHP